MCKTRVLATALLEAGAKPYRRGKGVQVKTPYELQNADIRNAIKEFTHFCDRFQIISVNAPEHATPTSVVLRATDRSADDAASSPEVAIKLMMNEDQFIREREEREGLDPKFVVEVICHSGDNTLKGKWKRQRSKLRKYKDYGYGIIMPAAQRNLQVVLLQERVDTALAKEIFAFLARALGHLHANGRLHGDFKVIDLGLAITFPLTLTLAFVRRSHPARPKSK